MNPAIDRTMAVDRLAFEDRAYILSMHESAGGRGINSSRVLNAFGVKTLAILPAGGKNGSQLEKLLASESFPVEVVHIEREARTNLTVSDRQGLTIKLNELGPPVGELEVVQLEKAVASRLAKAHWLMLCGSLPPGVPADFYSKLIKLAHQRNVKTLLDTDGEALQFGIEAGPTAVSPNQQEAERLLNRALITRAHFLDAASRIHEMGATSVLLSLGSRGVVSATERAMFEAIPPRIDAVCPIGAGDAMAAAFVWASTKKKEFPDCLRWAVAAGTASARLPGTETADLAQTKEVYKHVEVRKIG